MRRLFALFGFAFVVLLFRLSRQLQNIDDAIGTLVEDESETAAALRHVEEVLLEIEAHFSG